MSVISKIRTGLVVRICTFISSFHYRVLCNIPYVSDCVGEGESREQQCGLYSHSATLSEKRLRKVPDSFQLRVVQTGALSWFTREASLRPGQAQLSQLLVLGSIGHTQRCTGSSLHQRPEVSTFYAVAPA